LPEVDDGEKRFVISQHATFLGDEMTRKNGKRGGNVKR